MAVPFALLELSKKSASLLWKNLVWAGAGLATDYPDGWFVLRGGQGSSSCSFR
jgi:hypothetical protein